MIIFEDKIAQVWQNLVYAPKQLSSYTLDLTVKTIHEFVDQGQLDFGGGEYSKANVKIIHPKLEDDPKYGFWTLTQGNYLLTFNEIMRSKQYIVLIFPHQRLLDTGTSHPTFLWIPDGKEDQIRTNLQVGKMGIRLKENARTSRVLTQKIPMNDS